MLPAEPVPGAPRIALLWFALTLTTCVRDTPRPRQVHGLDARSARRADAAVDALGDALDAPAVPTSLDDAVAAVRRGDFRAVRSAMRRLPEGVQRSREGRYLSARAAFELGEHDAAAALLRGLGEEIPALRVDIQRMEAQALARGDHHAEARAAFEALAAEGGGERDRAMAAIESLAAGDAERAARTMRTWASDPPSGVDRARAWKQCATAFEALHDDAAAAGCWRRIAIDEPDSGHADAALNALRRLDADLTPAQSLERAANLIERARYPEALTTLNALAPGRGAFEARRTHLIGRAYYGMRGHYAEASQSLTAAGLNPDNPDRDEDTFMAARALSRADHDDEAVRAYDALARDRTGRWPDEAAFRAAWLEAHHERVDSAVGRFRAYLQSRPDAPERQRIEAWWHLGWTLYRAGRFAEAIEPLARSGALATHHLERGRGQYWSALARARTADEAGAVAGWQRIIEERPLTWYALLAESRLRERNVEVVPLSEPPAARPSPEVALPAKTRWLSALGFDHEAGAALNAVEDRLRRTVPSDRADESLARAYLSIGEARRAFILSSRHADALDPLPTAESRWVWDTGFPRPHAPLIEAAEDASGMPRHYLYAIMRQESGFNGRDVSNARAIGLLQMIPPTTRRVAQTLQLEYREEMLFDPAYNIRVGGWYIGRLYQQYHGVLPRAVGSFNAGPGAMNRWIQSFGGEDLDVFVERIPFDETRNYVRRVVQNLARYRYLYGPRDAAYPLRLPLRAEEAVDTLVDY